MIEIVMLRQPNTLQQPHLFVVTAAVGGGGCVVVVVLFSSLSSSSLCLFVCLRSARDLRSKQH